MQSPRDHHQLCLQGQGEGTAQPASPAADHPLHPSGCCFSPLYPSLGGWRGGRYKGQDLSQPLGRGEGK